MSPRYRRHRSSTDATAPASGPDAPERRNGTASTETPSAALPTLGGVSAVSDLADTTGSYGQGDTDRTGGAGRSGDPDRRDDQNLSSGQRVRNGQREPDTRDGQDGQDGPREQSGPGGQDEQDGQNGASHQDRHPDRTGQGGQAGQGGQGDHPHPTDPKLTAAIAAAEAARPATGETVRIDSWIWAVRLIKTRSLGATACKGGHVRVNGERVKPAHSVRIGDEVRLRHEGRERIVIVKRLIRKRVGAPVAVQCYVDNSPPPPPREAVAPAGLRDRGTGRPTKRDRRELERLRALREQGTNFGDPNRHRER